MSQIYKSLTSGPVPPTVPTEIETDDGTAVPASNTLIFTGFDSTENNDNGFTVKGGAAAGDPPGTGAGNEVSYYVTNRVTGTATTTDAATTQSIYSYTLPAVAGTYLLEVRVIGFNATDNLSAGYTSYRVVRSTGAAATSISATPGIISEESTMTGVLVVNGTSGNAITLSVNGILGKTIYWNALTTYIFVSAP